MITDGFIARIWTSHRTNSVIGVEGQQSIQLSQPVSFLTFFCKFQHFTYLFFLSKGMHILPRAPPNHYLVNQQKYVSKDTMVSHIYFNWTDFHKSSSPPLFLFCVVLFPPPGDSYFSYLIRPGFLLKERKLTEFSLCAFCMLCYQFLLING